MGSKLSGKDLLKIGFPQNNIVNTALGLITCHRKKENKETILLELTEVLKDPNRFMGHNIWGKVSEGLVKPVEVRMRELNEQAAPFAIFGENEIDEQAKRQLYDALKLPFASACSTLGLVGFGNAGGTGILEGHEFSRRVCSSMP